MPGDIVRATDGQVSKRDATILASGGVDVASITAADMAGMFESVEVFQRTRVSARTGFDYAASRWGEWYGFST